MEVSTEDRTIALIGCDGDRVEYPLSLIKRIGGPLYSSIEDNNDATEIRLTEYPTNVIPPFMDIVHTMENLRTKTLNDVREFFRSKFEIFAITRGDENIFDETLEELILNVYTEENNKRLFKNEHKNQEYKELDDKSIALTSGMSEPTDKITNNYKELFKLIRASLKAPEE